MPTKNTSEYTEEEIAYLEAVHIMFEDGMWYKMPLRLLDFLGHKEALLLGFLMGFVQKVNHEKYEFPMLEWFFCKGSTIERWVKISTQQQKTHLNALKAKGLIQLRRAGAKGRRNIRICWIRVMNKLHEARMKGRDFGEE